MKAKKLDKINESGRCNMKQLLGQLTFITGLTLVSSGKLAAQPGAVTSKLQPAPFEVEVVILDERGFQPARIVRKPGPFRLVFKNFREGKLAEFEIVDERGTQQKAVSDNKEKAKNWNEQLEFSPGTYRLRLKNLPDLSMQIVIDPNKR